MLLGQARVDAHEVAREAVVGRGQLAQELVGGSWIPAPPATGAIFGEAGEATWRRVVRSIGSEGSALEQQPPDVSWN